MTATAAIDVPREAKRRLRLVVETYYDVQEVRIETEHRIRQYAEHEAFVAVVGEARAESARLEGMESYRRQVRDVTKDVRFVEAFHASVAKLVDEEHHKSVNELMRKQEQILKRQAMAEVGGHPLWISWLSRVYGIGPCLAGGLIAWLDPTRWRHESQLWKYMGFGVKIDKWKCHACQKEIDHHPSLVGPDRPHPVCPACGNIMGVIGHADRREKGQKLGYNPRCKVLGYKIGESFVRSSAEKSGYRRLYDQMRAKLETAPCAKVHKDEAGKVIPCFAAHRHAKAKRLVVKIFLSHVYRVWRGLLGLPVTQPYPYEKLSKAVESPDGGFKYWGHDPAGIIEPIYDVPADQAAED